MIGDDPAAGRHRNAGTDWRNTEERYRLILDTVADLVLTTDREGIILDVNREAARVFGFAPDEFVGHSIGELTTDADPLDRKSMRKFLIRALKAQDDGSPMVTRARRRDGSTFDSEGTAGRGRFGDTDIYVFAFRNVTARRAAELARERSEAQLRLITENLSMAIMRLDSDLKFTFANRTAMEWYGRADGGLVGLRMQDVVAPARYNTVRALAERCLAGERVLDEQSVVFADGIRRIVNFAVVPYRDTPEAPSIIVLMQDITQMATARAALEQAQRMEAVGQLAGGIAHDFNNLLTIMSSNMQLIVLSGATAKQAEHIGRSLAAADRAADLVKRLMSVSRADETVAARVDLNSVMAGLELLVATSLPKGTTLTVGLAPEPLFCAVNAALLENCIINIVMNARDAMPAGGTIKITTMAVPRGDSGGGDAVITISDPGIGMPDEIKRRIFEPFFTTKELGRGAGLGLSTAYRFIAGAGGSIDVDSAPGQGATFRIVLPRNAGPDIPDRERGLSASEFAAAAPTVERPETNQPTAEPSITQQPSTQQPSTQQPNTPQPNTPQPNMTRTTILLVEDEIDLREAVAVFLDSLDFTVIEAGDAAAALAVLESRADIDVLFTDVVMPGPLTGVDLAEAARRIRPGLPILIGSGHMGRDPAREARARAVAKVIAKPYRLPDLAALLGQLGSQSDT